MEVSEGRLILVRVPKGPAPPYGTAAGLYQVRVGKNCMPYSSEDFQRRQVSTGALDWSAEPAENVSREDLSQTEMARLRSLIQAHRPGSSLLELNDTEFLTGLVIVRENRVMHAGFLVIGKTERLQEMLSGNEVIYLHHISSTDLDFLEDYGSSLKTTRYRLRNKT